MQTKFKAEKVTTSMDWDELVLTSESMQKVEEMLAELTQQIRLTEEHDLDIKLRPGFRALFYGSTGTGKTLTAGLMANILGKDLYCIDLASVISKYIGETEKNLSHLFDKAETLDWILFFDEADALFGKRTGISDAHDRYSNLEANYLLQRIENYPGIVILATNFRENIDDSFLRRCNTTIYFPVPGIRERYSLWQKTLSGDLKPAKDINLTQLSESYELTGAEIKNIVHSMSLKKRAKNKASVHHDEIIAEVQRQIKKRKKPGKALISSK